MRGICNFFGKLAADIRETFFITSSVPLRAVPEFRLFSAVSQEPDTKAHTGTAAITTETEIEVGKYQHKYIVAPYPTATYKSRGCCRLPQVAQN